jgi:putative transcriptional regulator
MTTKRENVPYRALPGAVLVGVEVSRCRRCGELEVAIPAIDELNRTLAQTVIRKRGRLEPGEIRFLRSYLGLSAGDFARLIGSDPATVSRWERGKQPIGHHTDLLLRAMVALDKRVDEYPIATFADVGAEPITSPAVYAVKPSARKWASTVLRSA